MGNRATVIFTDGEQSFSPAVYLHWNGGAESVYGFLEELNRRKARADQDYECARFIQLVGDFLDKDEFSTSSLGVSPPPKSDKPEDLAKVQTDKGDNGIYLVNRTDGTTKVRRFLEDIKFVNDMKPIIKMVEQSPEWVENEANNARNHEYGLLRTEFEKIANGRQVAQYG